MASQVVHELAELGEGEALVAIGLGVGGIGMDLDDEAVGADRGAGEGHRSDQGAIPGAVRRVDDDRQVRLQPQDRHGREVERVARGGLEGADAALAEDHVRVARREDVLGGHEPLLDRRREAALQEHRVAALADGLEQHEVLHVPRADLEDVDVLVEHLDVRGSVTSLTTGRPVSSRASARSSRAGKPRPWNEYGRRARLEGAAAEDARALALDPAGRREELLARLDRARPGHDRELAAEADVDLPDPDARAFPGCWMLASL